MGRVNEFQAGQTVAIDFKELRDSQTPDDTGRIIPLNLDTGQIAWSARGMEDKVLSGRSEQISLSGGVASTYSCYNCCQDSVFQTSMTPFSPKVWAGDSTQMLAQQLDINCMNQIVGPYIPDTIAYYSTNSQIASMNVAGAALALSAGYSNVGGTWDAVTWVNEGISCQPNPEYIDEGTLMEVSPKITGVSPTKGSVGGKIRVYITGTGFTSTTEVVPISGITFSNYNRSGIPTAIDVVFTIAGNATAGNNDVKVTAGSLTSNAMPIFIQIPKKARRDHTANTVIIDPGPGDIVNAWGQVLAQGKCGAYRNLKYTLTDQDDEALNLGLVDEEIGLTITEILSDIQVNPPDVPAGEAQTVLTNNVAQFGDILAAFQTPPCMPPFSSVATQKFKVTVGSTVFNLTTTNFLEITRSGPGQWTIASTNQTP